MFWIEKNDTLNADFIFEHQREDVERNPKKLYLMLDIMIKTADIEA
ncbi:hypothetical protein MTBBW1_20044 [Desulfamplus magnetovallimortis]|uniref:Uncharacterized protein n=1 Tax=Desulfamplus magnetovallimortis TaxID=1246637 RepID=A0A1W1HBI1_9BACT|nr:hypothetical protein MTBBW1_20044 [Desulfamplus magnetovallimortis]